MTGYGRGWNGKGGGWPGLRQVLLVRTTRELAYGSDSPPIIEDHYYLTSLAPERMSGQRLLELVRAHWLIENELHHVKDRTMREDAQRHLPGASTASRLRSLCVGLYRQLHGKSIPAKQTRLRSSPKLALRLLNYQRKPKRLL